MVFLSHTVEMGSKLCQTHNNSAWPTEKQKGAIIKCQRWIPFLQFHHYLCHFQHISLLIWSQAVNWNASCYLAPSPSQKIEVREGQMLFIRQTAGGSSERANAVTYVWEKEKSNICLNLPTLYNLEFSLLHVCKYVHMILFGADVCVYVCAHDSQWNVEMLC